MPLPLKEDGTCPAGYPVRRGNQCFTKNESDKIKKLDEIDKPRHHGKGPKKKPKKSLFKGFFDKYRG